MYIAASNSYVETSDGQITNQISMPIYKRLAQRNLNNQSKRETESQISSF